jgi:hypothetical protein
MRLGSDVGVSGDMGVCFSARAEHGTYTLTIDTFTRGDERNPQNPPNPHPGTTRWLEWRAANG